jgi:hypothetical protein
MNLTISINDQLLSRARALAARRGISVQELLRCYLESLVGERPRDDVADELRQLMRDAPGRSGGRKITRDDAYRGRV